MLIVDVHQISVVWAYLLTMKLFYSILPSLALASHSIQQCTSPQTLANDANTYDYIVTGSGPGGGTQSSRLHSDTH
jgi:hypothetical protein